MILSCERACATPACSTSGLSFGSLSIARRKRWRTPSGQGIRCKANVRRTNRGPSRAPLRRALELSRSGGAEAIVERVLTELAATGARPRRGQLSGVASLTPSQRRVAELAAKGLTTRQMAESLFITPKTVEFHLRHIYQKPDIGSRAELPNVLGDE